MTIATYSEAAREYAYNAGMDDPKRAWILTPWDSWEPNPHYAGPKVPHPEADEGDWCDDGQGPREDFEVGGGEFDPGDDYIPF